MKPCELRYSRKRLQTPEDILKMDWLVMVCASGTDKPEVAWVCFSVTYAEIEDTVVETSIKSDDSSLLPAVKWRR